MKRFVVFLVFGFLLSSFAISQSFIITDTFGVDLTNTTISVAASDDVSIIDYEFHITNVSGSDLTIKVKKTEVSVVSGSINYFCWIGSCYQPTTFTSTGSLLIPAGHTTEGDENLICDYMSQGNTGVTTIIYTIYDVNNDLDKSTVTVNYDIVSSSQSFTESKEYFSKPFPNPTKDFININYSIKEDTNSKIVINDILGNNIKTENLNFSKELFQYDIQNLSRGIYFCSLIKNGKVKTTNRFVVTQ